MVVADHLVVLLQHEAVLWDRLVHRQVVGVGHPTYGVGVVLVTVGEVRRTPAADRLTDELLRADEEREAHEHDDGELMRQTVHIVVVRTQLDLPDAEDRLEEAIHDG